MDGQGSYAQAAFSGRGSRRLLEVAVLCAAVAVGASVVYLFADASIQRVVTLFLIYLTAVIGLSAFTGTSGVMTFGHVGFMGLGAYIGAYLTLAPALKAKLLPGLPLFVQTLHLPMEASLPIACLIVGIFALVIGPPLCRMPASSAAIATLGFLIIVHGLLIGARDFTRGSQPIFGLTPLAGYGAPLVVTLLAIVAAFLFRQSNTGLQLQASRENELAARAVGVQVSHVRLVSWVLSAIIMAAAGVLIAHYLTAFSPKKFYLVDMFALLAMGIVGGMTTISGAIVGTVLMTVVTELTRQIEGHPILSELGLPPLFGLTQITMAAAILLIMYRRPAGLIAYRELTERADGVLRRFLPSVSRQAASAQQGMLASPRQVESLDLQSVSKSFAGLRALIDVSLTIRANEIVGLIGPNGSGKTTLLNAVSGIVPADEGRFSMGGQALATGDPAVVARQGIGRTFQNIRLFSNMSVRENVHVAASTCAKNTPVDDLVDAALAELDLVDYADRSAGTLPYGLQRRAEIARALAMRPNFLLLDEPTAGMNAQESDDILHRLQGLREKYGIGFLIIEHDQKFVMRLCERIYVLNKGEVIAEGPPKEIQKNPVVLEAYLGRKSNRDSATKKNMGAK